MAEYEIMLTYVGKNKKLEEKLESEYGFGHNPPIVVHAKNKKDALKQITLPKDVKAKIVWISD